MVAWVDILSTIVSLLFLIGIFVTGKIYGKMKKRKGNIYSLAMIGFIALFLQSLLPFLKIENIVMETGWDFLFFGNMVILTKFTLAIAGYLMLVIAFGVYSSALNSKRKKK